VHPLAGQGANLGFADAACLAACLSGSRDPGARRVLRAYERARAGDILAMKTATDGLVRLFSSPSAMVARLRNAGLNLFDRAPLLKTVATRHAAGTALW
jgi:2-polyprenyl-6-methoxyphenol hydroxylase-like FAD-dependent oxidoreductase